MRLLRLVAWSPPLYLSDAHATSGEAIGMHDVSFGNTIKRAAEGNPMRGIVVDHIVPQDHIVRIDANANGSASYLKPFNHDTNVIDENPLIRRRRLDGRLVP